MKKKILIAAALMLLLCTGSLMTLTLDGNPFNGIGDYESISGYHSQGIPPHGGSCTNVGKTYKDNPFHGWPADFRECDWAIISAYYCTPNYFKGYTHWGIDLASYWALDGSEAIHGAALRVTTDLGKVRQAVWFDPPHYNYGMGNFVQIEGWKPNPDAPAAQCSNDPLLDLANEVFPFCWAPEELPPSVCTNDPAQDVANGYFDLCWYPKPHCTFDPATDRDHGMLSACWQPTGWLATYMHMLDVTVAEDDWVLRGELIGHVDNTGNSTGDHLHYQINAPDWMGVGAVDPAPTFDCPGYDWHKGVEEGR